jgi:ABC-2 type transport system permease protein
MSAAFRALLEREVRALIHERTILIAFAIQLFVASFSSVLLVGLISIYDPDSMQLTSQLRPRVGVVGEVGAAEVMVAVLAENDAQPRRFPSSAAAQAAFEAGELDAAILLPETLDGPDEVSEAELVLPASDTLATLLQMTLRKPLRDFEERLRKENGIELRYQDIRGLPSTTYEFQYGALIPLLLFFPGFVTGGIVIDTISEEMVNHTLETLWAGPLSLNTILGAKMTAALAVSLIQGLCWVALLGLNGITIDRVPLVLAVSTLSATAIAIVSAFITLLVRDRERGQFIYALFILLTASLSFMSDLSPVTLLTRLATGDPGVGVFAVLGYAALVGAMGWGLGKVSRRLVAAG